MKKWIAVVGGVSLSALGAYLFNAVAKIYVELLDDPDPMSSLDDADEDDEHERPIHFTRPNEHEEAMIQDRIAPEMVPLSLTAIHLGDLSIECPFCKTEADTIRVGLGTAEDRESGDGDVNELATVGVVLYACGHIYPSPCMTDKIANILNCEEAGKLTPGLFENLTDCDKHGS